jgi:hypothetical protein
MCLVDMLQDGRESFRTDSGDVKSITATDPSLPTKYFDFKLLRTVRTRYGEPSGCGGAETRSWTLFK